MKVLYPLLYCKIAFCHVITISDVAYPVDKSLNSIITYASEEEILKLFKYQENNPQNKRRLLLKH